MPHLKRISLLALFCVLLMSCHSKAQNRTDYSQNKDFAVQKSQAEWEKELSAQEYHVLRERGTEVPFSSPLLKVTEAGVMACAACGNPLFYTKHKFHATCGWPSFDRVIDGAVIYRKDFRLGLARTEVICAQCGSHLGHVFNDGPKETTGKRYCINGVALNFIPQSKIK